MFYLIVALLLALYYWVAAPKTIKPTINVVLLFGCLALLLVLLLLGVVKLIQSPPEFFVGLLMIGFGAYVLRDVLSLSERPKESSEKQENQAD